MTANTYPVWNGERWTFEQVVEDLGRLVRAVVARTTPESEIDDCLQDAWLRLYERLEADPEALGPDARSRSPAHTRAYYANRVVWDAHKGSGFGPRAVTYYNTHIPESVIFDQDRELDAHHDGDVPGLDTVLFAGEHHRNWIEEVDVRLDLERAIEELLSAIRPRFLSRFALAVLCILHDDVTVEQGALLAGCHRATMQRAIKETRLLLQLRLRDYRFRHRRDPRCRQLRRAA